MLFRSAVSPALADVAPGGSVEVAVTIAVPADATTGGWYASIGIATGRPDGAADATAIRGRIVVPVWLAVTGDGPVTRVPVVERFAAVIEPDGRLGFRALIRDDGDTHLFATAHVTVGTAEQPAAATWDAVSHGVLPGQSVVFANRETLPVWTTGELAASLVVAPSDAGEATDFVPVGASTAFVPDGSLDVTDLGACENLDRGPTMRASLAATGSIGVVPAVRFDVFDVPWPYPRTNRRAYGADGPTVTSAAPLAVERAVTPHWSSRWPDLWVSAPAATSAIHSA